MSANMKTGMIGIPYIMAYSIDECIYVKIYCITVTQEIIF